MQCGLPKRAEVSSGLESGDRKVGRLCLPRPAKVSPPHTYVQQVGEGRAGCRRPPHNPGSSKVTHPVTLPIQHSPKEGPERTTSELALGTFFIHLDTVQILQFPFAAKSIKIIFI